MTQFASQENSSSANNEQLICTPKCFDLGAKSGGL